MTEIGRLQSIFSEHVLSQERVIDSISTTAIHSTEDIVYGNEQIREVRACGEHTQFELPPRAGDETQVGHARVGDLRAAGADIHVALPRLVQSIINASSVHMTNTPQPLSLSVIVPFYL